MKVYYLDHSGVAVETEHHLLVFDYYTDAPENGGLEDGVVRPMQLPQHKRLAAFASHSHYDHYNKIIHLWQQQRPDTLIFLGDDIPPCAGAVNVAPYESLQAGGLTVSALRSTDQGVAFVVQVDGRTIYHAGDLNWWHWEGEDTRWLAQVETAYKREIDRLRDEPIDLAFVPVDPRLEGSQALAIQYFMATTQTSYVMPIHLWDDYDVCTRLVQNPSCSSFATQVLRVNGRGDKFSI